MRQKVVVIGHGYTSRLGVIRALGRAGYEVIVVAMTNYKKDKITLNTKKPIDCYSKYVSQVFYCPSEQDTLIKLLLNQCADQNQKVVLFPDSDFSEASIDDNQELLREHFLFPHIDHTSGAVIAWMDKMRQKLAAKEVGLNVAEGWKIEVKDGFYEIPSDLRYPCFPKPLSTIVGGKGGLRRCVNEQQLREVVMLLTKLNPTITLLVEEFKVIDTEHALLGFSDGKEVLIPGIIRMISLANGGHFGVAKQGRIMPVTGFEDLIEQFKQFVLKTRFVGIFDIDFYESEGRYYFCEMNFRYGGSGYAYTAMGVNLPDMLVRILTGKSIDGMQRQITENAVYVNERMCIDDWYRGFNTTKEYKQLLSNSDISFVYDKSDTEPQKSFEKWFILLCIKRAIKKYL